jgi:phosphoribosylformylglycinamidine synthase
LSLSRKSINESAKVGVVVFPGTWSDTDCFHVFKEIFQVDVSYVWHRDTDLSGYDCVILPGGFSYGDYLRTGAIARFSPIMGAIEGFSSNGGLVIGICNGFQILCEAGLLPGVLMRNNHLEFRCQWTNIKVENTDNAFASDCYEDQILKVPISHGEGNYYVDQSTYKDLESRGQIVFRYCDVNGDVNDSSNPNGSVGNIAGISNRDGNVFGMMPHPERCCEGLLGGEDGRVIFGSMLSSVAAAQ